MLDLAMKLGLIIRGQGDDRFQAILPAMMEQQHKENIFEVLQCPDKLRVALAGYMFHEVADIWWKSIGNLINFWMMK